MACVEKRPVILILLLVLSFTAAVGLAAWVQGQRPSGSSGSTQRKAAKKLRARPGTQRENARALLGSTPSLPSGASAGEAGKNRSARRDPIEVWGYIAKPKDDGTPRSAEDRLADEALVAPTAEEGIAKILDYLEASETGGESSQLFTTLGTLYAGQEPVDLEKMQRAFNMAASMARNPGERVEAHYQQAKMLLRLGFTELALEALEQTPTEEGAAVEPGRPAARIVELGVMLGIAQEIAGDLEKARAAYEQAMEDAVALGDSAEPQIVNVYRQAGLRLARLHRRQGRENEAARVARHMKTWLGEYR